MKQLISIALAATLGAAGVSAVAQDSMKKPGAMHDGTPMKDGMGGAPMNHGMGMKMDMKKMDANGDGMISKAEFMKYHEAMYASMKKGSNGMVSTKDMEMMEHGDAMRK